MPFCLLEVSCNYDFKFWQVFFQLGSAYYGAGEEVDRLNPLIMYPLCLSEMSSDISMALITSVRVALVMADFRRLGLARICSSIVEGLKLVIASAQFK